MSSNLRSIAVGMGLLILIVAFNNCGKQEGTSTGNPKVSVKFSAYNEAALKTNQQQAASLNHVVTMCFKRLRFKLDGNSAESTNIDLELGEVSLSPDGTDLADVVVPAGTYTRIEFDLAPECLSGSSLAVQNSHGSFATADGMNIRFDGLFSRDDSSQTLELNIQAIVSALNTVTNSSQLRSRAESAGGSF